MSEPLRWRKMKKHKIQEVESLLRSQERWCMNACNRYLNRDKTDAVWVLESSRDGNIYAIIIHIKQNLLPVLCGQKDIPPPHFLRGLFGPVSTHSLQGRTEDVLVMETALKKIGLYEAEKTEYELMCIAHSPTGYHGSGPANLIIRKPKALDLSALAMLQAAYEQEEVLPSASEFNAAVSRLNIERIFSKEQMLVAELGGRLIGKINTNAATFTRYQVGGVYVAPDYRGLGIARRMAGEFIAMLTAQGRDISLFVKKSNLAARRVYKRIGFEVLGDYQISYY
ncbi:MAG: GNAT family N-acetyltransferase [Treponema sp.]|jgi:predicted GNAT family acetyltransferase|nr:GNAT family N-acetyltransferase [Treponema sp.]